MESQPAIAPAPSPHSAGSCPAALLFPVTTGCDQNAGIFSCALMMRHACHCFWESLATPELFGDVHLASQKPSRFAYLDRRTFRNCRGYAHSLNMNLYQWNNRFKDLTSTKMHSLHVQIPDTINSPSVATQATPVLHHWSISEQNIHGLFIFSTFPERKKPFPGSNPWTRAHYVWTAWWGWNTPTIYNIHEIAKDILAGLSHMDVLWFGVIWWFLGLNVGRSWCTKLEQGCPYVETTILSESNACAFVNSPERLDTCERSLCFLWGMNRETPK